MGVREDKLQLPNENKTLSELLAALQAEQLEWAGGGWHWWWLGLGASGGVGEGGERHRAGRSREMKQPQRALHSTQQAGVVLLHFLAYDQSQISPKIPEQPVECFFLYCFSYWAGVGVRLCGEGSARSSERYHQPLSLEVPSNSIFYCLGLCLAALLAACSYISNPLLAAAHRHIAHKVVS